MERPVKGDIVVLPFPYTDLSEVKRRPALVAATPRGENVVLVHITSRKRNDEDAISLRTVDLLEGKLQFDSFAIPSVIFTAENTTILYRAARLKQEKIREVEEKLCELFTR